MTKPLGGGNQPLVEPDQDQGPPQGEFKVGGVVGAQAMRRCQPVQAHEVGCLRVQADRQFAELTRELCPPGGIDAAPPLRALQDVPMSMARTRCLAKTQALGQDHGAGREVLRNLGAAQFLKRT